jgi:hypothetical protein
MNYEIYRNLKINILAYQPCGVEQLVLQTYRDCTTAENIDQVKQMLAKLIVTRIVEVVTENVIERWDRDVEHKWIAEQIIELNDQFADDTPVRTLYGKQQEILKRYDAEQFGTNVFEWVGKIYAERDEIQPMIDDVPDMLNEPDFAGPEFGEVAEANHSAQIGETRTYDRRAMTVTRRMGNGRTETMDGIARVDQISDLDMLKDNDRMGLVAVQDEDSVVFWIVDNGDHWQDSLARYYRDETWIDPIKHFKVVVGHPYNEE